MNKSGVILGVICLMVFQIVGGTVSAQDCAVALLDIDAAVADVPLAIAGFTMDTDSDLNEDGIPDYAQLKHAEAAAADINAPEHDALMDCAGGDGLALSLAGAPTIAAGLALVADPACEAACLAAVADLAVTLVTIDGEGIVAGLIALDPGFGLLAELVPFGDSNGVLGAAAVLAADSRTNLEVWDDAVTTTGATIVGGGPVLDNATFLEAVDIYVNAVAGGAGGSVALVADLNPLKLGAAGLDSTTLTGVSVGADPPETTFTWGSSDTGVATVAAAGDTATVTATGLGQTTITATGLSDDTVMGTIVIRVVAPEWFDLCFMDDLLLGEYATVAPLVGFPADADGDGVDDTHALMALAYTLCDGSVGPDPGVIGGQFAANSAAMVTLGTELSAVGARLSFLLNDITSFVDEAEVGAAVVLALNLRAFEAAIPGGAIDAVPALAGQEAALRADITGAADALDGLTTAEALEGIGLIGPFGPFLVSGITELAAGFGGLSSSSQFFITDLLQLSAPLGPNTLDDNLDSLQSAITGALTVLSDGGLAANDATGTLETRLTALTGAIGGTSPTVNSPSLVIFTDGTKGIIERYSGGEVFDPGVQPFTNAEVSGGVGSPSDFVAVITGTGAFPFIVGNPGLPVGGLLGLVLLAGTLAASGGTMLKRSKK